MPIEEREWKIIAKSVCGPTHTRTELPNQDSVRQLESEIVIVAVADGHGSAKSFRSDAGAKFATETAIQVTEDFFKDEWATLDLQQKQKAIELQLPRRIVKEWQEKVRVDLREQPLTEDEIQRVGQMRPEKRKPNDEDTPFIVYGATLLTVVITKEFFVYLQLGDGDILTIFDNGDVNRPVPADPRLFANQTTSLSSRQAAGDIRVEFAPASGRLPRLILLATDGYSNSFRDDESFLKAGVDFQNLLASSDGVKEVEEHLEEWLKQSAEMSGDDVTMGLIFRSPRNEARKNLADLGTGGERTGAEQ